ncbi:MAG: NAD(P)H:quinone oxidoreductase [Spirochaetota bacterium]
MKVLVAYYSMYGHVYTMATAVVEGIRSVNGAEAVLRRIPETLPEDLLRSAGAFDAHNSQKDVPVCTIDDLRSADAIIFGSPTRFGNMTGQMREFLDSIGALRQSGELVGKPAGVFTSSNTQHGGQESTILSFHYTLLHLGMIIVGLPYAFPGLMEGNEISGGSPYGASTIAGPDGSRQPSENELDGARFQGEHIAKIAMKLSS